MKWDLTHNRFIEYCGDVWYKSKNPDYISKFLPNEEHITVTKHNTNFTGFGDITGAFYYQIKSSAYIRNKEFNVSIETLDLLFKKSNYKCVYSGRPIRIGNSSRHKHPLTTTASLDRINNNLGYIEGNIQWVHKDINKMKQKYTHQEFIDMCGLIWNYNKDRI